MHARQVWPYGGSQGPRLHENEANRHHAIIGAPEWGEMAECDGGTPNKWYTMHAVVRQPPCWHACRDLAGILKPLIGGWAKLTSPGLMIGLDTGNIYYTADL